MASTQVSTVPYLKAGDPNPVYKRVFAIELQQTDLVLKNRLVDATEIIIPSGSKISRIFCCGTLTDIEMKNNWAGRARIADPTGVFSGIIHPKYQEWCQEINKITPPAFVFCTALIEAETSQAKQPFRLVLETISRSTREARDQWILETALQSITRLKRLNEILGGDVGSDDERRAISHYSTSTRQIKVLAGIIDKSLELIKPKIEKAPIDPVPTILNLIREHSSPRGLSIQDLIVYTSKEGLADSIVMETIRNLVSEDEIYQPVSGFVKIL